MSIQKKSLISSLKTVKKANVAVGPVKNEGESVRKTKISHKAVTKFAKASFKMVGGI